MFLCVCEDLIHSIWTWDEKVMDNLNFLGNLNIFLRNKILLSNFNANIFQAIRSSLIKKFIT